MESTTAQSDTAQYIQAIPFSNYDRNNNIVIIIDLEFLKVCPQLEGADIFKKLFFLKNFLRC